MTTIIHTHMHPRRTGVTTHVEDIVAALGKLNPSTYIFGESTRPELPHCSAADIVDWAGQGQTLIWHAHRPHELRRGLRLKKRFPKMRVLWTHHGWKQPGRWTQRSLHQSDALIALTTAGATQLPGSPHVIQHGVNLERFQRKPDHPKTKTIGIIGRIRPDKGQLDLVEAALPLLEEFPDWRLEMIGEIRPQHRGFAKKLFAHSPEKILHRPFTLEMEKVYADLAIVVMASHAEGFSLVMGEAMAMGCSVVATRLPHFEQRFVDNTHALFYPPGDASALNQQLHRLLIDESLRSRLSEAAYRHTQEHLSLERESQALWSLYQTLL